MGQLIKTINKLKKVFLDLISFGNPQVRLINFVFILLFLGFLPTYYLDIMPDMCIFRNFIIPFILRGNCPASGIFADCKCPACGMSHAMTRLLKGDFSGALQYNKLVFLVLIVMISLIIINLIKTIKYYKETGKIYPFK
ncbi:DUF2752 domain-containing protein [Candidatus Woesearchaeota archaeon]|nr:DUF2752 domain-containing protein [Candidatus Woesearchaeota archaeon]